MDASEKDNYILRENLDPVCFIERFLRVDTPDGQTQFLMDSYQKKVVRDRSRRRIIVKSKKIGMSTCITAEGLHATIIQPKLQVIFVSTGDRVAKELLGKTYDHLYSMPIALQPYNLGVKSAEKESAEMAQFANGSRIISLPSRDPGHIRGFGLRGTKTKVYVDEYAHVDNDKDLWVVVRDFAIIGGDVTLNSTPFGKRGKFYELADPLQAMHRGLIPKIKTDWSYHEIKFNECPRLAKQEKELRTGMYETDFLGEYELIMKNQHVEEMKLEKPKSANPVTFGIDFGKRVSETIIYVVEEHQAEHYRTLWVEVLSGVDYPSQCDTIKFLDSIFHPIYINVDGTGPGGQVLFDFLKQEKYCGSRTISYNLSAPVKESLINRVRILMNYGDKDKGFLDLPMKVEDSPNDIGKKIEMQLHGIQRTTTESGEHTRYSGKETGMDDVAWALALSVWKEFTGPSEPYLEVYVDPVLQKLQRRSF